MHCKEIEKTFDRSHTTGHSPWACAEWHKEASLRLIPDKNLIDVLFITINSSSVLKYYMLWSKRNN